MCYCEPSTGSADRESGSSGSSGGSGVTAVASGVAAALVVLLAVVTAVTATLLCVLHQRRKRKRKGESFAYYSTPTPQHRTNNTVVSDNTTSNVPESLYSYVHTHTCGPEKSEGRGSASGEDAEPAYETVKPQYANVIGHAYADVGPGYEHIGLQSIATATPYLEPVKSKTS